MALCIQSMEIFQNVFKEWALLLECGTGRLNGMKFMNIQVTSFMDLQTNHA